MCSLPIIVDPKRLRGIAEPYPNKLTELDFWFTNDLSSTVDKLKLLGLSAPQVGVNKQCFVYNYRTAGGAVFNPKVIAERGLERKEEACASLPGVTVKVYSPVELDVEFLTCFHEPDDNGVPQLVTVPIVTTLQGMEARIFAHELDHLRGKLITDYDSHNRRTFLKE